MPVRDLADLNSKLNKHSQKAYKSGKQAGCSECCITSIFLGFLGILLLAIVLL